MAEQQLVQTTASAPADSTSSSASTSNTVQDASQARPFRYFRPPEARVERKDPPDSYFQPNTADLMAAQASLAARTQALANAPLKTQAMREAEEKTKRTRWPTTTIRVKFSDRSQLEKPFPSTDKIRSVYAFVRNSLREDVKLIKFVLYQTPPKRELKVSDPNVRDLSLAELQLAPSSVLLLSFLDDDLNRTDIPAPLDPSVLAHAEDLPLPPDFDAEDVVKESRPIPRTLSGQPARQEEKGGTQKKAPKWFKMGTKR